LSHLISSLGSYSREISEILNVINDIAEQTNLLALNAAIEAARAGEQGRGFAVVADEVRKLAEKTSHSTTEIGDMIKSIQTQTTHAERAMDHSLKCVESGVDLSSAAGDSLTQIIASVNELQEMVQNIASSTEEISTTAENVNQDIEEIAYMSKKTKSLSTDLAIVAQNLAVSDSELSREMSFFRTSEINNTEAGSIDSHVRINQIQGQETV
jgi:methyl-accepting chemotaxis protein